MNAIFNLSPLLNIFISFVKELFVFVVSLHKNKGLLRMRLVVLLKWRIKLISWGYWRKSSWQIMSSYLKFRNYNLLLPLKFWNASWPRKQHESIKRNLESMRKTTKIYWSLLPTYWSRMRIARLNWGKRTDFKSSYYNQVKYNSKNINQLLK